MTVDVQEVATVLLVGLAAFALVYGVLAREK